MPNHLVTLTKQFGYHAENGYELNNNLWGMNSATSGSQATHYDGPSGPGIAWSSTWEWRGGEHEGKSYGYGARQFPRRLVSEISGLPTEAVWRYDGEGVRGNVCYDIFTHPEREHANSRGEYELMIW
jgi:xyloglucan-specific endo-beta-1,4-glucanase